MGGGGRGGRSRARTQRKHFKENRENVWKRSRHESADSNTNSGWEPFATQNPAFDEYYKEQGIVSPEEWDAFNSVIRKPLPSAFRVNSSSQFCADILSQLENDFMKSLQTEANDGSEVEAAIRPLPWYPENLAWQSNYSRMQLRKNKTLERFHEFLKQENEIGNITRQEAVSMVPPLFLDVSPDHFVLDMCAAPGSKTFQLLEIIHRSTKPGTLPGGMVVANDVDVQRCNLLIHQTKRMCTANLIVTNHEAQHFPGCRLNKISSESSEISILKEQSLNQLMFDRVLCDVPCSGDGTLRKAPDIWRKWNVGMGNGIHCLQVQIAMRGISLLKVGGRMVYSTCSMNPVENEAVVAEILRRCGGSVELVDVSGKLPQLVCRPGLKKWKVRDKGMWLASYKDVPKFRRVGIVPSMFPSGQSALDPNENEQDTVSGNKHENGVDVNYENGLQPTWNPETLEVSDHPLERCIRIVPHDQNTGAFFIAVLHKVSSLPGIQEKPVNLQRNLHSNNTECSEKLSSEITESPNVDQEDDTDEKLTEVASDTDLVENNPDENASEHDTCQQSEENKLEELPGGGENDLKKAGGKRKLQSQGKWKGVDPVVFYKDETTISSIKTFYGIDDSFVLNGQLVTRNSDSKHVKRIYYISKSVKDVLELNLLVGQQLKITSVGLKMFERQTSREGTSTACAFRISSEGLPLLLPYITKQILCASLVDFKHILQYKAIKYADFVDAEFGEKASKLMLGCCMVILNKGTQASADRIQVDASTIAIGCWKGRASLTVMVTAVECQEILERLLMRLEGVNGKSQLENKSPDVADGLKLEESDDVEMNEEMKPVETATAG